MIILAEIKRRTKKESVIGAIMRNQAEDEEKLKKEASKEAER